MSSQTQVDTLLSASENASATGDLSKALTLALQAVAAVPHRLDTHLRVTTLQGALGLHEAAVSTLDQMITKVPAQSSVHAHLVALRARALVAAGLWSSASDCAAIAASMPNRDVSTGHLIGVVYARIGEVRRARAFLLTAAKAAPRAAAYQYSLGASYRFDGRVAQAAAALERAIALRPYDGQPHLTLAQLTRWTVDQNHVGRLQMLLGRTEPRRLDRAGLHFAAHKECDDLGRWAQAWEHLSQANTLAAKSIIWDDQRDLDQHVRTLREYPIARLRAAANPSRASEGARPRLIFIVGLPRSGSSLVERILSAHSTVHSMSELPVLEAARRRLSSADATAIGALYRHEIRSLHGGKPIAIDKMPANHKNVGLIAEAFPDSLIIVTHRKPMSLLFGLYRTHLGAGYGWSYDLDSMVAPYRRYLELQAHWRQGLGNRLIEVQHESLVSSPEMQIRRLLCACGLEPEPQCFEPHLSPAITTTASASQVREPINDRGVATWRNYEAALAPLAAALSASAIPIE